MKSLMINIKSLLSLCGDNKYIDCLNSFENSNYTFISHTIKTDHSITSLIQKHDWFREIIKDILDENWSSPNKFKINASHFDLPKTYILGKRELLLPTDHCDALNTMLTIALATKAFLEARKANAGIPSLKRSWNEVLGDFSDLCESNNDSTLSGQVTVNYFVEECRYRSGFCSTPALTTLYNNLSFIGKIAAYIKRYDRLDYRGFASNLNRDYVPARSKPYKVIQLCRYIDEITHKKKSVKNYINLFGGWGYMEAGAIAAGLKRYIDTDPNKELIEPKQNMAALLNGLKKQKGEEGTEVILYDKPMQSLSQEELTPQGILNDLSFSSPPYFAMEKYQEADENLVDNQQSYRTHAEFADWFENIFLYSIFQSFKALKVGGFFAMHVGKISFVNRGMHFDLICGLKYKMSQVNHLFKFKNEFEYYKTPSPRRNGSLILCYQKTGAPFNTLFRSNRLNFNIPQPLDEQSMNDIQELVKSGCNTPALLASHFVVPEEKLIQHVNELNTRAERSLNELYTVVEQSLNQLNRPIVALVKKRTLDTIEAVIASHGENISDNNKRVRIKNPIPSLSVNEES